MNLTKQQLYDIDELVEKKYLSKRIHPEKPDMCILNYTTRTAFDKNWNEITTMCRGLIINPNTGYIYARPFKKFFNIEEHNVEELKSMRFEAWEKLDGSLGILYWIKDRPFIATRGSFDSPQAVKANEMLQDINIVDLLKWKDNHTLLFEIIYPENKIVIDYGGSERLVLLAVVNNDTGWDFVIHYDEFRTPCFHNFADLDDALTDEQLPNREGLVLKFENGLRVKFKYDEYKMLHKLLFQTTNKSIWKRLKNGDSFSFLENQNVPDDLKDWIYQLQLDLNYDFDKIKRYCESKFERSIMDRKQLAEIYKKTDYPGIMFSMHDFKNYENLIWKQVKPKDTVFFKQEE